MEFIKGRRINITVGCIINMSECYLRKNQNLSSDLVFKSYSDKLVIMLYII